MRSWLLRLWLRVRYGYCLRHMLPRENVVVRWHLMYTPGRAQYFAYSTEGYYPEGLGVYACANRRGCPRCIEEALRLRSARVRAAALRKETRARAVVERARVLADKLRREE